MHRLSSGSSEDEANSETENKPKVEAKQEELAIASPEPEPDESAQHDSVNKIAKEESPGTATVRWVLHRLEF